MNVAGKPYRTVWLHGEGDVRLIDQNRLPHAFETRTLHTAEEMERAIRDMQVRGAGCIGASAAFGLYLAACSAPRRGWEACMEAVGERLCATRPTASNLAWAVSRVLRAARSAASVEDARTRARSEAQAIADEDVDCCRRIGQHGLSIIRGIWEHTRAPVRILTHCNAGWLAFVDIGTATGPMYAAHAEGIPIQVWVDETRPRNQGARLTAWELGQEGVPHALIADNAGGHLMQQGQVDLVITGADRVTRRGDTANKIGTYLKALAARDNEVPFYVALPSSTFDFSLGDGLREIPIEERSGEEVRRVGGLGSSGREEDVCICPPETEARNWGFDVTPARLITGLLTERGLCEASEDGIASLYPESRA